MKQGVNVAFGGQDFTAREARRVTYIGNFLSRHGTNPSYAESLVPRLRDYGLSVKTASSHLNGFHRLADMVFAVYGTPRDNACVILDLYSGPRAFPAALIVARACRLLRKRYIAVLHGGDLPQRLQTSRASLSSLLRLAALVTAPSAYLAKSFEGIAPIEVIPNALEISAYPFRHRSSALPNCLYLRAFHRLLDPMTAVRAFSHVKARYPKATLRMVGPDEDGSLAQCQKLVRELGLGNSVEMPGRIPKEEVPKLGEGHDIFLNPTSVDNTPVSTIEAMAMGMCVVATTSGGLPYLLDHDKTGLLVQPGDAVGMGEAIVRLVAEPSTAGRLSREARLKAETMDWSRVLPRWAAAIESACNGSAARREEESS